MKKSTTIHKENSLIQSKNTNHLSTHSIKTLDNLYFNLQKHLNTQKKDTKKSKQMESHYITDKKLFTMSVKQTTIREWLGLEEEKNYTKIIRDTLFQLSQVIQMKNYIDVDGKVITWGIKSFIKDIKEFISKEDNKSKVYQITIDEFFFKMIFELKKNFTEIELEYQKNWKSVNTIRLYQYLKSIQSMKQKPIHDLKWFNEYFAPKTELKYLSKCQEILKRNITIINKDTDLRVILVANKKEKTFIFNIQNKKITIKNIGKIVKKF